MLNPYLLSGVLGIVEGLTEFLPVSSTAHLRLSESVLGVPLDDPFWKMFSVVIQLGAVLCLPVYFRKRLIAFGKTFPKGERGDRNYFTHPLSLVIIAFVCTAVPALLLKKLISHNLESLTVIGGALLIGGAAMWAVDVLCRSPKTEGLEQITMPQAIWVGLIQTLSAVFPGTSRSMATIAAGQTAGMSRAVALEFSFFLSIPTMAAATLKDFKDTVHPSAKAIAEGAVKVHVNGEQWAYLAIGFVVSFIVALVVVHLFMAWVRRRGFVPFAIYRIVLGMAVLLWARNHINVTPAASTPAKAVAAFTMPRSHALAMDSTAARPYDEVQARAAR